MYALVVLLWLILFPAVSYSAVRYADNTLSANCTSGNYSYVNRTCTGSDGDAYNTSAGVISPSVAGDTIIVRAGTWTQQWDFQIGNKSGSAGAYITMIGAPGERPILRYADPGLYGPIKVRGNRGYFVFENLVLDGALGINSSRWQIRDGNHHFILRNLEIKNFYGSGLLTYNASNITITGCDIHDQRASDPIPDPSRHYGIYLGVNTTNTLLEKNHIYDNPGGGIHAYPGPLSGVTIRDNSIHHNNNMVSSVGGILIYRSDTAGGGVISNVEIYNNLVYKNGLTSSDPYPSGITVKSTTGTKIWNNTIYNNKGYGVNVQAGVHGTSGTSILNNIITGNTIDATIDAGTSTTRTYNACLSGDSCGTTGKVTLATTTEPFVNAGANDYRLKQGTNAVRNAGTDTTARPNYVVAPDIGAYEQPEVGTLNVVGSYVELYINSMTPGILPTSGITGITVTCLGCTGTPVVDSANVKPASNTVIQLAISGITSDGTCRVTIGATNATDSLFIGGVSFPAQGLNSLATTTVTGTCTNSSGVSFPGTPWSHFALNEGSGTVASDDTGNNRHGTVNSGLSWVADTSGTGITIPTDATYKSVTSTFGSGINPTTQSFAKCAYVKPNLVSNTQKVIFSSGTNGSSQRWYAGWATVSGQVQWGIGIQGSGFLTGSEFVATEKLTLVCIVSDSATDTATLWVDGVKGTTVGKSVKSFTSYLLTNNLIVGNDGTNTSNNGGFTVYEIWIWNNKPTDQSMIDLYASIAPPSTNPCLAQTHLQWEAVYVDPVLVPFVLTPKSDGSIDVIANGGVAVRIQYTCTGSASVTISPRLFYSMNGTDFLLPVPQTLGSDNVAMWGQVSAEFYFNSGISSGCINDAGLTPHSGVTIIDEASTPTFSLAQNHCRSDRYVVKFGNVPGTAFYFRVKSDSGIDFGNGYAQAVKVNVVPPQASPLW